MIKTINIAIIQFPGSNCERETAMAVERAGMQAHMLLWNQDGETLDHYDGYILIGGFSYEDRSRAGIIASLQPIMTTLKKQASHGKPLLGICNGAQILVESGLIPGGNSAEPLVALTHNRRIQDEQVLGTGYYNTWVHLKLGVYKKANAFNRLFDENTIISVPIAHAEGRFIVPEDQLGILTGNGQIALQYCDAQGNLDPNFPTNPNGSVANLAALCNAQGNIMAIMPHPERTTNGDLIFYSMRDYIHENHYSSFVTAPTLPINYHLLPYQALDSERSFIIKLKINDNQAASVETALQQQGLKVSIQRLTYWQLKCNSQTTITTEEIAATGELWNSNKEFVTTLSHNNNTRSLIVLEKDDLIGLQKKQLLQRCFHMKDIHKITHGVIWQISSEECIEEILQKVMNTHILFNPKSHDCFLLN